MWLYCYRQVHSQKNRRRNRNYILRIKCKKLTIAKFCSISHSVGNFIWRDIKSTTILCVINWFNCYLLINLCIVSIVWCFRKIGSVCDEPLLCNGQQFEFQLEINLRPEFRNVNELWHKQFQQQITNIIQKKFVIRRWAKTVFFVKFIKFLRFSIIFFFVVRSDIIWTF